MKIQAVNLTKTYFKGSQHEVIAVKDASINIEESDFCLMTGPSGSGKTTLLCLLGLLTKPTKGKVIIDNEEVSTYSDAWQTRIRKDKIGFIFQQYNLLPQFTAWENVALPNLCRNMNDSERKRQAIEIMTDLGLADRVDFKVASLSGGEQQRVAVARALITNPEIIFADEPTAAVDEETANVIIDIFQELKQKGKTIIVSTHDKSLINIGTMHLTINRGEIKQAVRS